MARATLSGPALLTTPGFLSCSRNSRYPHDYLLDVGCGGGALLRDALRSGCRAAGVDHSPEMVAVAREANAEAISGGRLEIHLAEAHGLPFPDGQFSCATMMGVLGFLRDPVKVMSEIRRVLSPEGEQIIAGTDPELRALPRLRNRWHRDCNSMTTATSTPWHDTAGSRDCASCGETSNRTPVRSACRKNTCRFRRVGDAISPGPKRLMRRRLRSVDVLARNAYVFRKKAALG